MKRKSASVNERAKALLDLIAPAYVMESEVPDGYLSLVDVAQARRMSLAGAQSKMRQLLKRGLVDVIKVKQANGKIAHYYGAK